MGNLYHAFGETERLTKKEIWEMWELIHQDSPESVREESRKEFEKLIRDREKWNGRDRGSKP